ncbi:histone deacetylase [Streptomyces sp. NPDC021093]|uniref:histone deacetylase n=1 Tax=Streptomyces sp. NPDC021093 TaxID=3365112 RepID=UPI00379EE247
MRPPAGDGRSPRLVWYTSYGSNTHARRLSYYLAGGRPPGAALSNPGCRDPRPPAESVPVELDGVLYFATESALWTGGRAFFDPAAAGRVLARAYLVTEQQFCDIAAQEMYRRPGGPDLDLSGAVRDGRAVLGPGRYETLVCPGTLRGHPLLTFTAPWGVDDVAWNRPSAAYLRHICAGLTETGAWSAETLAAYVAGCPGAAGAWSVREVAELLRES